MSSESQSTPTTSSTAAVEVPLNPQGANLFYPTNPVPSADASASISAATLAVNQLQDASGRQPTTASSSSTELSGAQMKLKAALRHFADFPIKGIDFVDIMPLFMDSSVHATLLDALELQIQAAYSNQAPDVVVGLDARGFLFGPGLALRLGVGFAPVRKKGKLPGPCVTAAYEKEYGTDFFQMQQDAIKPGQKVLVVDDIIATGKIDHRLLIFFFS
jgi:adenine phosphoribosyltransferase